MLQLLYDLLMAMLIKQSINTFSIINLKPYEARTYNTSVSMRFCPSVGSISDTESHMSYFGQLWSSVLLKDCFIDSRLVVGILEWIGH